MVEATQSGVFASLSDVVASSSVVGESSLEVAAPVSASFLGRLIDGKREVNAT